MADISKINPDGTEYDLKDATARQSLSSKADKVSGATSDDFATLDSNGNLTDSGINSAIVPSGATSSNKLATTNDIPTELNDLSDDVIITSPQNAQVLTYNSTSGKWENQTGSAPIGGAVFKGSILFANIPTTGMTNGDWYDIKDAFTTDNRFEEGSGIACAAGTDIIWVAEDDKWNILTPSGVYSFNGRNGAVVPAAHDYDADQIDYDNTTSELTATNTQDAIDEVASTVQTLSETLDDVQNGVLGNTELIKDTVGWSGKNLIAFPYQVETFPNTNHSVVFNLGENNKIIATSGTATGGNTNLALSSRLATDLHCLRLPKGRYIVNGNPKNASNHDFYLYVATTLNDAYSAIGSTQDVDELVIDVTDEMMEGRGFAPIAIYAVVRQGVTANGEVFEPMLRKVDVLDDTYEPYHADVLDTLREAEVVEGKNLYNGKATSKTDAYGLTWTVDPNDENIITVSGTPTGFEQFNTYSYNVLPTGNYIISGILENTNNIKINTVFLRNDSTNVQEITFTLSGNEYLFSIPQNVSYNNLLITLKRNDNNVACSGTVKLMVRKATETDPTYEPYYIPLKDSMFPREEQRVLGAKNLANESNIEAGRAWNGDINSARARWIIPIEDSYEYIASISGTNSTSYIGYVTSPTIIPSAQSLITVSSFPVKITPNLGDKYIIFGFSKTSIIKSDVEALKFMLRLASDPDNTYVPYVETNRELSNNKFPRSEQAMLGAKNLDGTKYEQLTSVVNGITWTVNSDGSITANGTSTEQSQFTSYAIGFIAPFNAQVLLSGSSSSDSKVHMYPYDLTTSARPYTDSSKTIRETTNCYNNVPVSFWMEKGHLYRMTPRVDGANTTVNNFKFYPMLRLASDPDDTYVPYVMTNAELSEYAIGKSLAGQTVQPTSTETVTAGVGAEIFNMYKEREYDGDWYEGNVASGEYSHAEGYSTTASGGQSHAEGRYTIASGGQSHAEGYYTTASGTNSHASGNHTTAGRAFQFVAGKYNNNKVHTLFEIGNGTNENSRSNAFEVFDDGSFSQDDGTTYFKFTSENGVKGYYDENYDFNPLAQPTTDNSPIKTTKVKPTLKAYWVSKQWNGVTQFSVGNIWTDGDNIYYSSGTSQYVLDKSTSTWYPKTWSGLTDFIGYNIWTDGDNIYYSSFSSQYAFNKITNAWYSKIWSGNLTSFDGASVWTDGDNIYYSNSTTQYVLDVAQGSWTEKTWNGLVNFSGQNIWTDGDNIYYSYSYDNLQYVLDKSTSTWSPKTWSGFTNLDGANIWTDGKNIYHSNFDQYVLDKETSTWSAITWGGYAHVDGAGIWTDGNNIYYSSYNLHYVLRDGSFENTNDNSSASLAVNPTASEISEFSDGSMWLVTE